MKKDNKNKIYFADDLHYRNYNHLINMVFRAREDNEYKVASYILALPEIYSRCINDPLLHEFPFLWIYVYEDTSYTDTDEYGEYKVISFETKKDAEGKPELNLSYVTLSSGLKKLVQLASNLFNGENTDFNLMDALATWDEKRIRIFFQAIDIRLGKYQGN